MKALCRHRSRTSAAARTTRVLSLLAAITASILIIPGLAQAEILYQLRQYGNGQAVITFSGPGSSNLTTNISADGLNIRVSAVSSMFVQEKRLGESPLIGTIQQVRRGAFTDLLISLKVPINLNAAPSGNLLKLYLKSKQALPSSASNAQTASSKTSIQLLSYSEQVDKAPAVQGLSVLLPYLEPGRSELAKTLITLAYLSDLALSLVAPAAPNKTPSFRELLQSCQQEQADLRRLLEEKAQSASHASPGSRPAGARR
jgi:hypothetical protein